MSFLFAALAAQPGRGGAGGGAELDLGALMGALGGMGGGPPGQGGPAMKPIHELLMGVMDADKSGGVSLQEALAALSAWESFSSFGAGPDGKPPESAQLVAKAKEAAPAIFGLLDADANGALSATELKWTTDAHELLKKPMLKNLSLAIFAELDADADESVTEAEVQAALDGEALDRVVALLREKFPIPALDAKNLPRETMKQHVGAAIKMVDTDGDGAVGQKEIVRAAKRFKDTFMSTVKQIEAAAPMMQMMAEMQKGPAAGGAGAKPRKPRPKREL